MSTAKVTNISNLAGTKSLTTDDLIDRATCRAWVNFDGTTNVGGSCTRRASFNVNSVTDNGPGDYTINFTNAMPDANYSWSGVTQASSGNTVVVGKEGVPQTTTALRIKSCGF